MTDTESAYFHVVANQIEFNEVDFGNFIDSICDYYHDLDIINFGKFTLPLHMIPWIDEFIQQSTTSSLVDYELIELTDEYYFFKVRGLYFHVTWKRLEDSYEFAILHGVQYSKDETGIYVFHDDDDDDTIVPHNYGDTNISDLDDFD